MLSGPKFASASDHTKLLHFLALCYAATAPSDGFVPEATARGLTHASRKQFEVAIAHLTTVQPMCENPSWIPCPGGWILHDYDDPLYGNPMREDSEKRREQKVRAGAEGGKKSALARLEKYGTTQPINSKLEADPEAPASKHPAKSASGSASAPNLDSPPPEPEADTKLAHAPTRTRVAGAPAQPLPSLPVPSSPSTHGDVVTEVANGRPAHPWATVSRATLIGHVGGWFLNYKQWHDVKPQTRVDLEADATAMVDIGIPGDQLHAILTELATKRDPDDVYRLSYFWQPVQDEQHARTKQQQGRSHVRTDDELTKVKPVAPARGAK